MPDASIIIPTFERASTLAASLRSALGQTVTDIEVVVVGDGCTDACREIARRFVDADPRVRFLDLPKAPFNGAANRDIAVREAGSERIFYNDDDDLLLPHHVEVLGAFLDTSDVVDTPVASVRPSGDTDLGLHDSAEPVVRRLLAEGTYKAVFDTHLAHTKSVYLDRGAPWAESTDRRSVLHFLQSLASDEDVRWRTTQRVTALSFHGARRATMAPWQRRTEIERWERITRCPDVEAWLRRNGGYAFHTMRFESAFRRSGHGPDDVVRSLQTAANDIHDAEAAAGALSAVNDALALAARRPASVSPADKRHTVLKELLGGSLGAGFEIAGVMRRFAPADGLRETRADIVAAGDASTPEEVLAALWCDVRLDTESAHDEHHLRDVLDTCPTWDRYAFALEVARILFGSSGSRRAAARSWCDRAIELAPPGRQAMGVHRLSLAIAEADDDVRRCDEATRHLDMITSDGGA